MISLRRLMAGIAFALAGSLALANDPGGGANGVGANVTLTSSGGNVILANGIISATIATNNAKVTSYLFNGRQMLDASGLIYYSMDGGTSYEQPANCVYRVATNTTDMVDISCRVTWADHTNRVHAFDIDVHYVLRRGDTGLYGYAVLSHPETYPATGVGEWRLVWKLPHTSTDWTFERIYVDALRNWYWGTYQDFTAEAATGIAEVGLLTTGLRAGQYDCKYEYSADYQKIGCWGHASDTNGVGVWVVLGGCDYLNDGPTKNDLTLAESYNLLHFGRNHYNGSGTSVAAGENWSKIYGPYLLYCNQTAAGAGAGDVLWADARAQVQAEVAAWPYAWLSDNTNYPVGASRGAVSGRFSVNDPLKPSLAAGTNTWIGLAQPDPASNWQFDSKHYQYWTHPDAAGHFVVPAVRPGIYTLYAFTDGAVGEFSQPNVVVSAGATNALGDVTWTVPHPGGRIAWEIGVPDRSATEFRHGHTDYWYPFLWNTISNEWSNPLEYFVGTSNWTNDWNYVHPGYLAGGTWSGWKWRIHFTLTNLPSSGSATLTIAWASADSAAEQVFVNNESSALADFYPSCLGGPTGGNAHIREGIHAKYGVDYVTIPLSALQLGTNIITLVERRTGGATQHVMYDYVSLELPGAPPTPPSGRSLTWVGGSNANTWDLTNTLNWLITSNGAPATFTNGDNVAFDDSGNNSVPVTKTGSLSPGLLTVTGNKTWTLGGPGSLDGSMTLFKTGTNRLVLNGTNNFTGGTTLDDGVLQLGTGELSNAGIGVGPITFTGGTLQLNGYGIPDNGTTAYGALPNHLVVAAGESGTILCPQRIGGAGLGGSLTGAGTLNLKVDYVRGQISGDWSGFNGLLNVSPRNTSGDLRFANGNPGLRAAAINLSGGVSFYLINHFYGSTTFAIGSLAGPANTSLASGSDVGGRIATFRVGGRNDDATFAGSIRDSTGATGITKVGAGRWTLSGTNTYSGLTAVAAGTLQVVGVISNNSLVVVSNGATLDLPGVITANTVQINAGGFLTGCGTLNGNLLNDGTVVSDCGAPGRLTIFGNVTNNGTLQCLVGSGLQVSGVFVNNGLLDLLTGAPGLPVNFINNGVVLDRSNLVVAGLALVGMDLEVRVQSYAGHGYQLQRTASLATPEWQNVGAAQDGDGTVLTFTDAGGATVPQGFYRFAVTP
ncbi:MAG TPA: polysaccharide lyase family protein [Verrucomicrobiae bacterium]|nr:polysaccharide lyase family protein [Verrucomicrobiae bacterium]